jgi:outer membrane biosynthesis protein TonB
VPSAKPALQTAEILPEKPVAKPKPVVAPKPKPKSKKVAQSKTVSIKTPISRPKPPKPPKQKQASELAKQLNKLAKQSQQRQKADAMNGVLQNLAEAKLAKEDEKTQKAIAKQNRTSIAQSLTNAIGEAVKAPQTVSIAPLGLSELDLLRAHISSCWQPPIGAKGADQLKVDIQVKLEKDGSVKQAEIADRQRYGSDVLYRAAANSARRAVLDCQPLPLPPEKYQFWKEFIFGFDPKFM